MTPGERPILWDIYAEHLDEAAFLWGQWERALDAAHYTLSAVVDGPEERLLAHLDGLVLGGKLVADKLLLPALEDDDPGKVFAAAWSLLQSEHANHLDEVVSALSKVEAPARAALGRALELSAGRTDLAPRLAVLWEKSETPVRGALFDTLAARDAAWQSAHVGECLDAGDATLQSAALRALRSAPQRMLSGKVEEALGADDAGVREEAIATAYVMGLPSVWAACHRYAKEKGRGCRLPLALLALRGEAADRAIFATQLQVPEARRHLIWALGFLGDTAAVETILGALDDGDERVARVAGEALTAITGTAIAGPLAKPGVTKGPGVDDVGPEDPVPEALPEDLLLVPAADAVRAWWRRVRGAFGAGARYVYGHPRATDAARSAQASGAMWRRTPWYLELAASMRAPIGVGPRAWARLQKKAMWTTR